jgi:integrase
VPLRVTLKGVNRVQKKLTGGQVRTYFYHRATNTRLEGQPGSPEFLRSYEAAERKTAAPAPTRETFASLVASYTGSADFAKKAHSTQTEYLRLLKSAQTEFGSMPLRALNDPDVRRDLLEWRDKVVMTSGAREADNRLSIVSAMLSWAADRRYVSANHLLGFKRIYKSNRKDIIWTPDDISAFQNVASHELQLAMALALFTGQRQADLLSLTWSQYDGTNFHIRQGKTGRQVVIPCAETLGKLLVKTPKKTKTILCTNSGKSWKKRYFASEWQNACARAGIAQLHFHDLRGTSITILAQSGATVPEIAAITGHSLKTVTTILESYLSRTVELADAAISKLNKNAPAVFANWLQTGPWRGSH